MIGKDTSLTTDDREYLERTVETLENDGFVDTLDREHARELDKN